MEAQKSIAWLQIELAYLIRQGRITIEQVESSLRRNDEKSMPQLRFAERR